MKFAVGPRFLRLRSERREGVSVLAGRPQRSPQRPVEACRVVGGKSVAGRWSGPQRGSYEEVPRESREGLGDDSRKRAPQVV